MPPDQLFLFTPSNLNGQIFTLKTLQEKKNVLHNTEGSLNRDNKHQHTWLAGMQCGNTDNMEYQQDMFTYALNGDGTAYGKKAPLSNTSVVYDYSITQDT